jgi:hypothetical protein
VIDVIDVIDSSAKLLRHDRAPVNGFVFTAINEAHATLMPHADNTATFTTITNKAAKPSKPKPSVTSIEVEVKKFKESHI